MPHLISRGEALKRISFEIPEGECIACYLLKSKHPYILSRTQHTSAILSQYPRTWGQTMIILNSHKTSVSELKDDEWQELMSQLRKFTTHIESRLKPLRCYISSLGSTQNLLNTCPHIHFNIVPVYREEDTPSKIFTWQHGLYDGNDEEWSELYEVLRMDVANNK